MEHISVEYMNEMKKLKVAANSDIILKINIIKNPNALTVKMCYLMPIKNARNMTHEVALGVKLEKKVFMKQYYYKRAMVKK